MSSRNNGEQAYIAAEAIEDRETEIDLLELLRRLMDSLKYIILATLLGALLMGIYSFYIATPKYKSNAQIYVISSKDSVVDLSALQIGSYLTSDYQEVFKTWEVHERVIQNMGLEYSYEELQSMITITNPANTRILAIEIQSDHPVEAADMANEYAEVAREYIAEKMSTDKPNILSVALPSVAPFTPNKTRNILIGAVVGMLAAVVVITILFVTDDKIRSSDDITKYTGMPILTVMPLREDDPVRKFPEPEEPLDDDLEALP